MGVRARIRSLLDEAVATGELAVDPAALVRAVQVVFHGSLLTWAVFREGRVQDWVADDLDQMLQAGSVTKSIRRSTAPTSGGSRSA